MKNRILAILLCLVMTAFAFSSCGNTENNSEETKGTAAVSEAPAESEKPEIAAPEGDINITFEGDSVSADKEHEALEIIGSTVKIKAAGRYIFSGTLNDGAIVVEAPKTDKVDIVLAGVNITNSQSAPVYIMSCDKAKIVLEDGSENFLTDAKNYKFENGEDKPNACIYSSEDIDFEGNGSLTVVGNYNNGIGSKNDIDIESGIITVRAANNGIKGNDSVSISGGKIIIEGADDGIKSDNETEAEKGFVRIDGGEIFITADDDAIQAFSAVTVNGGSLTTNAGGKAINCDGSITLAEGVLTEN